MRDRRVTGTEIVEAALAGAVHRPEEVSETVQCAGTAAILQAAGVRQRMAEQVETAGITLSM